MKIIASLVSMTLSLLCAAGCGGGSTESGAGEDTVDCLLPAQSGLNESCQHYDATGQDAATVIANLTAQCTSAGGFMMSVAPCPSAGSLGGCKSQVKVQGATATLFVTNYFYPGSSVISPSTAAAVQAECETGGETYVTGP